MIYEIPAGRREGFDACLKLALRGDRESYRTFRRDLAELDICLQEDVRGKKCAPAIPAVSQRAPVAMTRRS